MSTTVAKAYDNILSVLEFEEDLSGGMSATSFKASEFIEQSARPADAYYFPLDGDARGYAPGNYDTKTINPVHASDLAFDEDGCWVGTAVTNLWPMKSSHSDDQIPDDPAGVTFDTADIAVVGGCTIVTNSDGSKTVTATNTDPMIRIGDLSGAVKGKDFIFDITVHSGTIDGSIGFYIKGNSPGEYNEITNLLTLGMAIPVVGQRVTKRVYLPPSSYPYAFVRLDIVNSIGASYTIHAAYIGTGKYLDGDYSSNNLWGWVGDGTLRSSVAAFAGDTKISLTKPGGATATQLSTATANSLSITAGTSYTVSAYYRQASGTTCTPTEFKLAKTIGGGVIAKSSEAYTIPSAKPQWERGFGTALYSETVTAWPYIVSSSTTSSETRICGNMIEAKPFVSAWCKTSRSLGMLTWNLHTSCNLNWNEDYTIIYWKKAHGTANNTLDGYSIDSIGRNSNTVGGGYLWWGKTTAALTFGINGSGATLPSFAAFQYKWNMYALRREGTNHILRVYGVGTNGLFLTKTVDNSSATTVDRYVTQDGRDLQLGGWDQTNACNSYYRDLLVIPGRAMSNTELDKMYNSKLRIFGSYMASGKLIEGII